MQIRISIDVDYDETSIYSIDQLILQLENEVSRFVQDGGLSPTGEEVIDSWDSVVEDWYE